MSMSLQDQIIATAELCGAPLSKPAMSMLALDLDIYPPESVSAALRRCRMEHKGRLTAESVISRIDDGRPGPEEAWAMIPRDESASVVWTDEMAAAYGVAYPLISEGEHIAGRMAFLEHYRAAVSKARLDGVRVNWVPSLGFDQVGRARALQDAADKGRIPQDYPMLSIYREQVEAPRLGGPASVASLLPRMKP